MGHKAIVVTNCTNRKRVNSGLSLSEIEISGPLASVAGRWAKAIGKVSPSRQAQDVYAGRSFVEARRVAEVLNGTLHVISAGLGVVDASDSIPSYDLTVAGGTGSLKPLLARLSKEPADWWSALTAELGEQSSVRALLGRHADSMAFFALPGSYVELIEQDLASLTKSQIGRIRIVTSDRGQELVPDAARDVVLPYDERLEGSSYAGTRTDFAQRALRHFIEVLGGHRLSAAEGRVAVEKAMRSLRKPVVPIRERKTDVEIMTLLRKNWHRFDGSSTRLLRYLRDEAMVACEQGRFRGLWCVLQRDLGTKRSH
ncbi:hypothetical protein [Paraburkholderia unamae]|uniref:Uncharacterized protein n=1 Tax=Paraburkholderia unamae TaxID=219649 RepID=A0ABX5KVQ8_9BURK|nr:hypothetical protein [Paraburkholderia unamae]PVX97677.1 hypothetical protein C7402_101391 [Paraburkholderia unamae]